MKEVSSMEILYGLETMEGFALQAGLVILFALALFTWIGGVLEHRAAREAKEKEEEEVPTRLRKAA